jgi:hypothetical protein
MTVASVQEKRRYTRIPFEKPVALHQIAPSGIGKSFTILSGTILAQAKDISTGGMSLLLPGPQNLSETLKLSFSLDSDDSMEIYGRVAWKSGLLCGLEFILRDEELLTRLHTAVGSMLV